ncbi:hypothetical protein QFC21_005622 [Naganishia friedmannii]|uniref:Uncharacterized protein n=1 Tax=Naganishia friedmannii TaxID=89922 RepID=A0ACC2V860_9TREE|nr:hypothetical protein QFC21_005622 [Naganishia friedmannii]
MPPRKKGAGKAAAAKRAEKLAAASPTREASASDAAVKSEAAGPAADPSVVEANGPLVVKAEGAEDGYQETKPQADPPQVQPSTASDAGTAPMNEDAAVPVKEEADSLTPCSQARQRFSTPPNDEEIDSSMHQPSELQKESQAEIKQDLAVTYPESDTEEAASKDQNAEPMVHIEQRLEEIEMEIAEDEAEIEASDAMDTPFSTEKIRHTSPISARVLQNVRALKEEILNGGGNMSGIGRLARFTLDQIDDNPDGEMPDVQGDVTMADASAQGPVRDNAASLSKVDENSSKNVTLLDPSKSDNQSRGNFAGRQYSSTDPWPRSGSGVKRDQLDSGELARGFNPEDSRALKRPRNDPPLSDRRERKSDQDRPSRQFEDSVGSRAGPLRDDDQGARVGRRERFSDQPVYHQLHSRPVHGNVQREEHRDTARGSVRPTATERRVIGAFPDPPRPPPFAPPASQPPRNSNGPPFFPPPAQFSAAAPPPPPAFVPSAQSLGSNASLSAGGAKRLTDTASGPHSSPYPSRFNAGFDRENESQQSQKRLPNSAPGSTERRGFQDRMPPLSNARPPVTNRTREEPNLANKPPLPSLTAANLGANARHDDAPPRATGRALSKASDDGRSNASEARRLALEGPGTVGPPGRRVPPGSAALRAELEARQQARGVPRYRYVGHIDVERGVLEVPGGLHEDLNGSRPSRFSPDSQSARGPSFNVSSSSMAGRPPADAKPFSTSSAPVRSQDPQRPPFALGPNNSGVQSARDVPDNMFEPHRDFASRSGQGGPVYGGGPMGSRQGFAPSVNARGLDNREIDRRPPIVPPVRQNYDEQVRARPLPYSGDRNVEPSYNAFPHGGPARTNSMQEDLRQVLQG